VASGAVADKDNVEPSKLVNLGGREHDAIVKLGVGDRHTAMDRAGLLYQVVDEGMGHAITSGRLTVAGRVGEGRY
jgi:hypothetical protein